MLNLNEHKENLRKTLLSLSFDSTKFEGEHWPGGIYGENAIVHIIEDDNVELALKMLKHTANWFLHEHPTGRKQNEEPDFAAIKLIMALYDERCYSRLTDDVKAAIKGFFLKNDFRSVYASENHSLMFRVSRLLAAQFYKGEYFEKYEMTSDELYKRDSDYVDRFMTFRARQGWGEFDSLGYLHEDITILNTLYSYTDSPTLKNKAKMLMDILFLDMIADSVGAVYGGAHGRSYPGAILDRTDNEVMWLYSYFFGGDAYRPGIIVNAINLYSDYLPSETVYAAERQKALPFENRERKNLHSCYAWYGEDIAYDRLRQITGSLNKYTYLTEDYILGGVNLQTEYYPGSGDNMGYAHHQQHEWELSFPDDGRVKIFTHHPGKSGAHNHWTGDLACCCGSFYTNKNTAVAMYNIADKNQLQYIHAFCPVEAFKNTLFEKNYIFLEYGRLYISLYFSEGYRINTEGEYANKELISEGDRHAVVLRVEYKENFASLSDFAESIKKKPVLFDKEAKTVNFDGIELRKDGNSECGVQNVYPYGKTYDCPFMQSEWDSGIIEVSAGDKKVVYDFIKNEIR